MFYRVCSGCKPSLPEGQLVFLIIQGIQNFQGFKWILNFIQKIRTSLDSQWKFQIFKGYKGILNFSPKGFKNFNFFPQEIKISQRI